LAPYGVANHPCDKRHRRRQEAETAGKGFANASPETLDAPPDRLLRCTMSRTIFAGWLWLAWPFAAAACVTSCGGAEADLAPLQGDAPEAVPSPRGSMAGEPDAGGDSGATLAVQPGAGTPTSSLGDAGIAHPAVSGPPDAGAEADSAGPAQGGLLDPQLTIPEDHCLADITDYGAAGPFAHEMVVLEQVKIWVPRAPVGCRLPVLHFASDRGVACSSYVGVVERLASHGFVVACYESPLHGSGEHCMVALETVLEAYPEIVDRRLGAMGHGPGALEAFLCAQLAEQRWGSSMLIAAHGAEPESTVGASVGDWESRLAQVASPSFMFSGSEDWIVAPAFSLRTFEAFGGDTEVVWYEGQGASHAPPPERFIHESALPWFRWKLLGDRRACRHFKALPDTGDWTLQQSRNDSDC
jgi:hypothetical protein